MASTETPLVSICMVCYNHERYVARAIESCLKQTYANTEIIIVDNASIDNSSVVIERYAEAFELVRFYSLPENTFPSYGFNFAIKQSKGEYVSILSADDYFECNKIESQLQYMRDSNITNSFTWVNIVNDKSEVLPFHDKELLFNREFTNNALKAFFLMHGNTLCAGTAMLHRSIFDKYGYFDHRLLQLQDYDFWLRIIKDEPIHILSEKLTNYCVRDDGENLSSGKFKEVGKRDRFEMLQLFEHILDFDLDVLSAVTHKVCTKENKYKNLYDYYVGQKNIVYANGVLLQWYKALGHNFDFPSVLYLDFFKAYSQNDFFREDQIRSLEIKNHSLNEIICEKERKIDALNEIICEKERKIDAILNSKSMKLITMLKKLFFISNSSRQ